MLAAQLSFQLDTPPSRRFTAETERKTLQPPPAAQPFIAPASIAGGEKSKARDIIAAIRTLKNIEQEQRPATGQEKQVLARFAGFGPVALSIFPDPVKVTYKDSGWQTLGEELKTLLSPAEYDSAKRTTFNVPRGRTKCGPGIVHDYTADGRPLKWLALVDEYTRECFALRVARSIKAQDAIDLLAEVFAMRGAPEHLRSDNGQEFIATAMREWLQRVNVGALYIEPGSPWENGYAESFNSKLRDEFLNVEEFDTVVHARSLAGVWQADYNDHRPHSALGYLTPSEFARTCAASVRAAPSLQQHTSAAETVLS